MRSGHSRHCPRRSRSADQRLSSDVFQGVARELTAAELGCRDAPPELPTVSKFTPVQIWKSQLRSPLIRGVN